MDDNAFCAVCDRQIVPKRILVPVYAIPEPSPDAPRQKKLGRTGLPPPVKTRIEIDQSPAPLYCSDQCRQRDTAFFHGAPTPFPDSSDTSDEQGLLRRLPRLAAHPPPAAQHPKHPLPRRPPARVQHAAPPPPTCATYDELAPPSAPRAEYVPPPYTSGIMMASRRIDAVLPKALKPGERPPPLAPVPGWTDGSQAWRASTYSFAPPPVTRADVLDPNTRAYGTFSASPHRSAGGVTASGSASSSGSGGLHSPTSASSSLNSELLSSFEDTFARRASSRLSLASSSTSPASSYTPSASTSASPPRRSKLAASHSQLLLPEVLLRPSPKHTSSISSRLSSSSSDIQGQSQKGEKATRRHSSGSFNAQRRTVRSPLSNEGSVVSGSGSSSSRSEDEEALEEEEAAYVKTVGDMAPPPPRPNIETRSWSYDNVRTYPVMVPTETRVERRIELVDGVEREVEVKVEVPVPPERRHRKRLFTFAPVVVSRATPLQA
ncbi:hypothetical protein MSAN_01877600 [Mycena sanguinolenta]|uniref:Uncharacterized protein n=1 Tax=Mycena sanguinolenta TaxID=230812 RepID=A0A8H7CQJ7_9AGAR|nr:hypothetical protein MSAN_01877600 [Mycena sanguinolenta]